MTFSSSEVTKRFIFNLKGFNPILTGIVNEVKKGWLGKSYILHMKVEPKSYHSFLKAHDKEWLLPPPLHPLPPQPQEFVS